ncbi:TetR/AcrR family transcriptional regulator [Actinocorallia sp. API 0066]|uniref:TetR/AcrR family transcriptional regulator n=1 Tax=Actinocorallia sp. API 0066 TaxID=2896846 RepID=UPI001E3F8F21|nr:TetR/AcrR family transcriptional regulator [Actinocorallia sp. API 0066]MCD0451752.1 TetR/AcrR family transcriptional regulator [Actinocorallia sp. API 0066]
MTKPLAGPLASDPPGPSRAMRMDARRNRDRLLAVAAEVFAEEGVNASLNEIAKRAEVGAGTLYRHFPTREALLESVLHEQFEDLERHGRDLLAAPPTGDVLAAWLRGVITQVTSLPGLASVMMTVLHGGGSELEASCSSVRVAGADLLERVQAAGEVRAGIDISDLLKLVIAIALATEGAPAGSGESERLLDLLLAGVRRER